MATKLNGHNYLEWAQSTKLAIDGRGKIGHLTSEISKPVAGDPNKKNGSSKILLLLLGSSIQWNLPLENLTYFFPLLKMSRKPFEIYT
jgi:hypothetical protein